MLCAPKRRHLPELRLPGETSLSAAVPCVERPPTVVEPLALAEKLTGKRSPELTSLAQTFPPELVPADAEIEEDWRELLAQMESFVSPRCRD